MFQMGILTNSLLYIYGHMDYLQHYINNTHIPTPVMDKLLTYMPNDILPDDEITQNFKPMPSPKTSEIWDSIKDRALDPYLSPLIAADLTNLPPAYITVCQYDVLRDDGLFYARRLQEAGVTVETDLFEIGFHGWHLFIEELVESDDNMRKMSQYLKKHL